MSKTASVQLDPNLAPFRKNVTIVLLDADANMFVGDLISRKNDKRAYTASMIEGGIDEGETIEVSCARELKEELCITNAVPLLYGETPIKCLFEDWKTAKKYAGKLLHVAVYSIQDKSQINLNGQDKEGPTFLKAHWLPADEAKAYLMTHTSSDHHKEYIAQLFEIIDHRNRKAGFPTNH